MVKYLIEGAGAAKTLLAFDLFIFSLKSSYLKTKI